MPCRYDETPAEIEQRQKAAHDTRAKMKRDLDLLTRLLCGTMKQMSPMQVQTLYSLVPELKEWWEDHKLKDAKREAQEAAAKQKRIAKLRAELKELEG